MSTKTILLVDDDSSTRQILKTVLKASFDYEIIEAPNGASAIAMISAKELPIDVAILDIIMAGHGGSVGDYLRKEPKYNNTLIIYYSALDKNQFDNKILKGALYVLKDGKSIEEIVKLIKNI